MGLFTDDEKMFIPLSVDNVDTGRTGYFFSNKKMIGMFVAILPYIGIMSVLLKVGAGLIPILVVTAMYLVIFAYFLRYWVFEEVRLRKMLREKDENEISQANHFWLIDKVGSGKRDDGLIYYQRDGSTLKRGLVVYFDRGSNVGVPKGHYNQFRKTKMEFMRELYARGLDFQWYDMEKAPEMPKSLIRYADMIDNEPNDELRMLLKLQVNINSLYTMESDQRYVDYIVITNKRFANMKRFRTLVEDIVQTTLRSNGYIKDAHILNKEEVDQFFRTVLMLDVFNSSYTRKSVDMKPFNQFAKLKRVIDEDGHEVPLEVLDDITLAASGKTLEDIIKEEERKEEEKESLRKQKHKTDIAAARKSRMKDDITHEEYQEVVKALDEKYDPETYDPDADRKKREQERAAVQQKREAEREEKRDSKRSKPDKDWYKSDKPIEAKKIEDTEEYVDILSEYLKDEEANK